MSSFQSFSPSKFPPLNTIDSKTFFVMANLSAQMDAMTQGKGKSIKKSFCFRRTRYSKNNFTFELENNWKIPSKMIQTFDSIDLTNNELWWHFLSNFRFFFPLSLTHSMYYKRAKGAVCSIETKKKIYYFAIILPHASLCLRLSAHTFINVSF